MVGRFRQVRTMKNEAQKTLIFLGVAVLATVVAWLMWPGDDSLSKPVDMVGKMIVPSEDGVESLDKATGIEIVRWDDVDHEPFHFAVQKGAEGRWTIPSHSDYPADAKEQFGKAAAALTGVKVLSVAGDSPSLHSTFGLLDPEAQTEAGVAADQIGTRIIFRDSTGKEIVDLIVGKESKEQPGTWYVRYADHDPVYQIELDMAQFSTDFQNWIEKDLLQADGMLDLSGVMIDDYSIQGKRKFDRSQVVLNYSDQADPRWSLNRAVKYDEQGNSVPVELAADEELATGTLDLLRASLGELAIVDVCPKPECVKKVLRREAITEAEAAEFGLDLQSRGFFLAESPGGGVGLYSSEGQIWADMSDGVSYVLRFGRTTAAKGENLDAMGSSSSDTATEENAQDAENTEDTKAAENTDVDESGRGKNRYLFVSVEFHPESIEKPVLQPIPDPPAAPAESADEATRKAFEEAMGTYNAEKAKIEAANSAKQQEYDTRVTEGQQRAETLEGRFNDWYYVVSDAEYQKIHLAWEKIVQKKKPEENGENGNIPTGGPTELHSDVLDFGKMIEDAEAEKAARDAATTTPETPVTEPAAAPETPATEPTTAPETPVTEPATAPETPAS